MPKTNYIDIMEKNHMEIPWHDYTNEIGRASCRERVCQYV